MISPCAPRNPGRPNTECSTDSASRPLAGAGSGAVEGADMGASVQGRRIRHKASRMTARAWQDRLRGLHRCFLSLSPFLRGRDELCSR
ncbi:hypothetical protein BJA01nite_53330 [Bradyrhizobium japonicum]|nr:hypothetical protein BJA01nite_53330 [Bradyrhizobium japonicum]